MKKYLWKVEKTHSKQAYNDSDKYSILTFEDKIVGTMTHNQRQLQAICDRHNSDILEIVDKEANK